MSVRGRHEIAGGEEDDLEAATVASRQGPFGDTIRVMRRLVMLGIAVAAGCGDGPEGSPVDGFWRADANHSIALSSGRYEAGDRDAVGICRSAGVFLVAGATVKLHSPAQACAGAPDGLTVDGDRLRSGERAYVRANPAVTYFPAPAPPDAL
jgi:hypothetical protein